MAVTDAVADHRVAVIAAIGRRHRQCAVVAVALLSYLIYAWFAFDVPALLAKAEPERAVLLARDSVAYKVHVTKNLRRDTLTVSIEGERTSEYETPPDWVRQSPTQTEIDLGEGYSATIRDKTVEFVVPGYGTIRATATADGVAAELPGPKPDWMGLSPRKLDARPDLQRRVQISRTRIEVHRYSFGWENFFFPFDSPLHGLSVGDVLSLAAADERLDPARANWRLIFESFWDNPDWQHGTVFVALLETILMAVLGTFTAAFVGLPLAFLAARNFSSSGVLRFFIRRLFDFVRGIDMLIWSLIFIRAFGLGPLTGALAIAFTDTGTLGKLFSEALENIDSKQVDGVKATGANRIQRYRFGVIPQILPVLISQSLYYLESNTRSATVIGALGAGGIGLMLVETMRTGRDWENTLYIIVLTIALVMVMDSFSSWLRRKMIDG